MDRHAKLRMLSRDSTCRPRCAGSNGGRRRGAACRERRGEYGRAGAHSDGEEPEDGAGCAEADGARGQQGEAREVGADLCAGAFCEINAEYSVVQTTENSGV
jgi:hypothetical protein